jgi:hypothetical protein
MAKSLKEQLTRLAATQIKTRSGETYAEALKREVDRLYDCIQARIEDYYNSYQPKIYRRTYRFEGALYAENLVDIRVVGTQIQLSLRFHPELAYHDTWTSNGNGYVPILLNYGFENNALKNYLGLDHHVEHLTYLKPQLFIENGIMDWNRTNKLGLTIDVTAIYNGKQFSLF